MWGGGLIVENIGLIHTAWIGGVVVLVAYALTVLSGSLDKKQPLSTAPINVSAH